MGFRSMTGSPTRCALAAVALAIGAVAPSASAQTTAPSPASSAPPPASAPPTPDELRAARELFQEAFKDEQEKRFPVALEKFQRVAKVKESASVRYRIATVLLAMGRLRESRDMYRALAVAKPSLPAGDQETADSAAEKAAELDQRIPKLALRVQDNPPADVRVTIDGAPVPVSTAPRSIELDPGEHVVAASARGVSPSEQTVMLADGGGEVAHTVTLAPDSASAPVHKDNTLGWGAVGGGGVLLLTGAALLIAREGAIDDIETTCPSHLCPSSTRSDVESDRSRAELFGPVGVGLGVVGLAAIGVGVYLLVRSPPASSAAAARSPLLVPTARGFSLRF
jgi:hypothetical protein